MMKCMLELLKVQIPPLFMYKKLNIFSGVYDLYDMFNYYNNIIFGWELKPTKLYWSDKLVRAAGICVFKKIRGTVQYPITIKLSFKMLSYRNEYEVTNVLVHEMIHALLIQRGIFEKNQHGPIWTAYAIQINKCFGLNVMQVYLPNNAIDQYLEDLEAKKSNTGITPQQIQLAQIPLQQLQQEDDEIGVISISSDNVYTDSSDVYSV